MNGLAPPNRLTWLWLIRLTGLSCSLCAQTGTDTATTALYYYLLQQQLPLPTIHSLLPTTCYILASPTTCCLLHLRSKLGFLLIWARLSTSRSFTSTLWPTPINISSASASWDSQLHSNQCLNTHIIWGVQPILTCELNLRAFNASHGRSLLPPKG